MDHRKTARLGIALLLLAVGLALLPSRKSDKDADSSTAAASGKARDRGALSGSLSQRTEQFRSIWRSASTGSASPQELELALELIQSLPAPTLKELLTELAPEPDGMPDLLAAMAKRIGDLEAERGLKWLVAEASNPDSAEGTFEKLFKPALDGWSDRDPVGLLSAFFDDDKALEYRMRQRELSTWGDDAIAPDVVTKAAERDPDEVWRLLSKWQRSSLGDDFFKGLDPSLAPHFASRIKDLFEDSQMPGFQHLGGTFESWEGEQKVRRAAATAWFSMDQEKALAWFAPTAKADSMEQAVAAGALSSRFYQTQPERAMSWLEAKPEIFRVIAAAELSYDVVAAPDLADSRMNDLTVLVGWIEKGKGRRRWLRDLPAALADRQQFHRLVEVTDALLAHLDLTEEELAILENQRQ